jgi:hypothetical protein
MKTPLDPRSTQRKRARKVLFKTGRPYICAEIVKDTGSCGQSPIDGLPPDAPKHLELGPQTLNSGLQANHINKNIMDNDPANLEWLCAKCHKNKDKKTSKGVSIIDDEMGYGL